MARFFALFGAGYWDPKLSLATRHVPASPLVRSIASLPFSQPVSHYFSMRRFNLLVDGKGGFSMDHCLRLVFQLAERESHIPERVSFAPAVAGLACDLEDLLKELDGAADLSQGGVGCTQVAERVSFAPAVAGLACDRPVLLKELDGAAGLSQVGAS
jgi:hypothetical protein